MYYFVGVRSSSFAALRLQQLNIKYDELTANEQMPHLPPLKAGVQLLYRDRVTTIPLARSAAYIVDLRSINKHILGKSVN